MKNVGLLQMRLNQTTIPRNGKTKEVRLESRIVALGCYSSAMSLMENTTVNVTLKKLEPVYSKGNGRKVNNDPKTLIEAVRYYADRKVCFDTMLEVKWPDGKIVCPKCGGDAVGRIESRSILQCKAKDCRKQFSIKVGTIFEDSPLSLDKWFVSIWCIADAKNGISSHELARALGVTQKTAWFMLHRVRLAMKTNTFRKLEGEIESDETFIGGKAANMHKWKREKKIKGRGSVGKAIVHGILERGGQVRAAVVPNTESETLIPEICRNVAPNSYVYTDANPSYLGLVNRYVHKFIDHATKYVEDRVHTNGLENFWSLLKRAIRGTYVSVAPFHLGSYLDEQAFRYNERKHDDGYRFKAVLMAIVGKKLSYRLLTAQGDAGFMGIQFKALLSKLVKVPKKELDREVKRAKAKAKKREKPR